jgi:preprotein translocase subunit SecY
MAAALCEKVPLPGLSSSIMAVADESGASRDAMTALSVFALALTPFISAFVVVEVAALLVPGWHRLRTGPAGRARLRKAAVVVGVLLAFIQSVGMARWLESAGILGVSILSESTSLPMPAIMLLLTAAPLALHLLTVIVDRHGLGNGYAVVLLGLALPAGANLAYQWVGLVNRGLLEAGVLLLVVLGLMALGLGVAWLLRGQAPGARSGTERPSWLPLPVSGLAPISFAAALLSLPAILGNLTGLPFAQSLQLTLESSVWIHSLALFVLSTLLTVGFSLLFHPPQRVGATWAALTARDAAERSIVHGRVALRTRELLPAAAAWSLLLGALTWLPSRLLNFTLALPIPDATTLLLSIAIGLDLLEEVRMRREGSWVPAWPLIRAYEVEPTLAALSTAGIPARARGAHARALLQFFAPYFPIDVMVPPERAAEARALLEATGRG